MRTKTKDNLQWIKKHKELEETQLKTNDKLQKMAREKAALDARLQELSGALSGEEGRAKGLEKAKQKYETQISELEERLRREEKARIDKETSNRKLLQELEDLRDRCAELERQIDELHVIISR